MPRPAHRSGSRAWSSGENRRVRTDRASRLIQAPPALVYRAFVDAAALAAWLPPEGMRAEIEDFDPRPGGGYRMALIYDEPEESPGKSAADRDLVETRFVELVPNRRIVQQGVFESPDPAFAGTMTILWEFEPAGEGTRVNITCRDVPQGIGRADHLAGLKSSLANLAAFVEV
jgi:uncharacterized protein YndB with AHSA1/START domain